MTRKNATRDKKESCVFCYYLNINVFKEKFCQYWKCYYFCKSKRHGKMAERSNAAVLKTVVAAFFFFFWVVLWAIFNPNKNPDTHWRAPGFSTKNLSSISLLSLILAPLLYNIPAFWRIHLLTKFWAVVLQHPRYTASPATPFIRLSLTFFEESALLQLESDSLTHSYFPSNAHFKFVAFRLLSMSIRRPLITSKRSGFTDITGTDLCDKNISSTVLFRQSETNI